MKNTLLKSSNHTNTIDQGVLSPRDIWGKVIIYLREHHCVALHIACGDITDVVFDNDKFIIGTTETFLYDLLKSEENQNDLKRALKAFNIENFEVALKEKILTKSQRDIAKLNKYFDGEIIIEGD